MEESVPSHTMKLRSQMASPTGLNTQEETLSPGRLQPQGRLGRQTPVGVFVTSTLCPDLQASFRASEPCTSFLPAAYKHFCAQLCRLGRRLTSKGQFENNGVSIKLWAR